MHLIQIFSTDPIMSISSGFLSSIIFYVAQVCITMSHHTDSFGISISKSHPRKFIFRLARRLSSCMPQNFESSIWIWEPKFEKCLVTTEDGILVNRSYHQRDCCITLPVSPSNITFEMNTTRCNNSKFRIKLIEIFKIPEDAHCLRSKHKN